MLKKNLLLAALASSFALPALAEDYTLTPNIGFVTDYLVRGISQTSGKPALQGGVDFAHNSGVYLGLWASNISWITDFGATGSAHLELDTYGGYKNTFATDYSYDVGYIRYNYLGSYTPLAGTAKADTHELYGSLGYKWFSAKYSYSLGDFLTVPNAKGTSYLEANASYTLDGSGVTLGAHYGKQTYKGSTADSLTAAGFDPSYSDYKLTASKDFSGYVVGLAYSSTNAPKDKFYTTPSGKNLARATAVLSVLHSF